MTISASMVKQLRERTGAGMMECKKALVETDGNIDAAVEHMRKAGLAKADKKAGRVAAEGRIVVVSEGSDVALVEVNCETDFVAGGDDFTNFSQAVAGLVLAQSPADLEALMSTALDGQSVEETRRALVARIGENINVRRFARFAAQGMLGTYLHGNRRYGVAVDVRGGDAELVRDLAMHVAAMNPTYIGTSDVPAEVLDSERDILREQSLKEGKPPEIVEKMVEGRLRKHLAGITLLGQPFVKDGDVTVEKLLKQRGAEVLRFVRFEVGEGIEREAENFAEEVAAQVRKSQESNG